MNRAATIEAKLQARLAPTLVEVLDESGNHNVPRGAESHFKVVVVSAAFAGLARVRRHQLVYEILAEELRSGVHALAVTARTPDEWSGESPDSPPCLGGSKT